MQAVILAGGKGTRLGTLTASLPKPLVPVGGKPVLEHQILLLKKHGIPHVAVLTGHLGSQIKEFVGDGSRWGISISCVQEEEPQGTAGALRALQRSVREPFLLFSGDVMLNFDVTHLIDYHESNSNSVATCVVRTTPTPLHSDLVELDSAMRITDIFLRPHAKNRMSGGVLGIASVYVLAPAFLEYIPQSGRHDIEKDIFPRVLAAGGALYGYQTLEYLRDMGTLDRLNRVREDYKKGVIYNFHGV